MSAMKTICVLIMTEDSRFEKFVIKNKNTYILSAYSSMSDAIKAMDDEFYCLFNEILFKGCKAYKANFYNDFGTSNAIDGAEITYTLDGESHMHAEFRLEFIDLSI